MSTFNLITARATYAATTRLASAMWKLAEELNNVELTYSVDFILNEVANSIYYNSGYTAGEEYETVEEFRSELNLDGERGFERNGDMFHIRPFFSGGEYMRDIGVGYLTGYLKLDEFDILNCERIDSGPIAAWSTDVSTYESIILIKHYYRESITLINKIRELRVAMHYISKGLVNAHNTAPSYAKATKNEAIINDLVAGLIEGTTIAGLPEVPTGFSSNNNHIIRILPDTAIASLSAMK